jgi:hypothetical protein
LIVPGKEEKTQASSELDVPKKKKKEKKKRKRKKMREKNEKPCGTDRAV